jgi:hypothetical protein
MSLPDLRFVTERIFQDVDRGSDWYTGKFRCRRSFGNSDRTLWLGLNEKIDARDAPVGNDAGEAQGVVPVNLASEPSAVVHRTIRSGLPRVAITCDINCILMRSGRFRLSTV